MAALTATDEEMDFIRRIIATPDDDAPRLIFADWLEERGKDAESIRNQVNRTPSGDRHQSFWIEQEFVDLRNPCRVGFAEHICCTAEWWLAHADELVVYHPIRRVTLTTGPFTLVRGAIQSLWPAIAFTLP